MPLGFRKRELGYYTLSIRVVSSQLQAPGLLDQAASAVINEPCQEQPGGTDARAFNGCRVSFADTGKDPAILEDRAERLKSRGVLHQPIRLLARHELKRENDDAPSLSERVDAVTDAFARTFHGRFSFPLVTLFPAVCERARIIARERKLARLELDSPRDDSGPRRPLHHGSSQSLGSFRRFVDLSSNR